MTSTARGSDDCVAIGLGFLVMHPGSSRSERCDISSHLGKLILTLVDSHCPEFVVTFS